jgi:thiol-disulfide isomerase/thioredoxin
MKQIKLLIFILLANVALFAQSNDIKASNEGWLVNLDEAYAVSQKTGKPILANFTGSDWCGWCKRLTNDVFSKPEFKKWADKNVVLLELDFPRNKQLPEELRQQNAGLQQAFGVGGYPTIWVFNLVKNKEKNEFSIEPIGRTGYMADVNSFTEGVDNMIKQAKK